MGYLFILRKHNVIHKRHQSEIRPRVTCVKAMAKFGPVDAEMWEGAEKQTDAQTAILRTTVVINSAWQQQQQQQQLDR